MANHLECEIKSMINEQQYLYLYNKYFHLGKLIKQENIYFNDRNGILKNSKICLRIRTKQDSINLYIKTTIKEGNLDMKTLLEDVGIIYTFLETVYTTEMVDDSYIHYEHYSGNLTHGNLTHTGRYDMELHEETGKPINTIIISTGNPNKSETECWIGKVNKYTPIRIIFLKK